MARINVYVDDPMKEAMDEIGDRANWSSVAQAAFGQEIQRIKWPEEPKMDDVIERLRTSKAKFEAKTKAEGQKRGRDWAMKHATFEQLRRVAKMELSNFGDTPLWQRFDQQYGSGQDRPEESFWYDPSDGPAPDDEFVDAFVEGAQEVWNEVADKV